MIKIFITGISLEKDCGSNPCMADVLGLAYISVSLLLKGEQQQQADLLLQQQQQQQQADLLLQQQQQQQQADLLLQQQQQQQQADLLLQQQQANLLQQQQ